MASGDITPSSSRASSPRPHALPKDDVTKLPRQDMHTFGQCPVQVTMAWLASKGCPGLRQGCQIFLAPNFPLLEKYTKGL
jgi:hypothetical protein